MRTKLKGLHVVNMQKYNLFQNLIYARPFFNFVLFFSFFHRDNLFKDNIYSAFVKYYVYVFEFYCYSQNMINYMLKIE